MHISKSVNFFCYLENYIKNYLKVKILKIKIVVKCIQNQVFLSLLTTVYKNYGDVYCKRFCIHTLFQENFAELF